MSQLNEDTCLQCHQTRYEVRTNNTYCSTVSGYEYVEVDDEWERHHWRDWSDAELRNMDIHPNFWDRNRRTPIQDLEYVWMESKCFEEGHVPEDLNYAGPDRCPRCFISFSAQIEAGETIRMRENKEEHRDVED